MYFHLVGIREKNGKQYQMDFLITGGDFDFIKNFLGIWGVVIVYLDEYKEDPITYGNIYVTTEYKNTEIKIILTGDDLKDRLYFVSFLGLDVKTINFINNPIPEEQIKGYMKETAARIKEEAEQQKKVEELLEKKEKKKYEEKGLKEGLEALNFTIDRLEQLRKIGQGILSGSDIKKLEETADNMKKIRLGTNLSKMAMLIFDAQDYVGKLEEEIFSALDDKKFLIDRNSYITNIDVISQYFTMQNAKNKVLFGAKEIKPSEYAYNIGGIATVSSLFFIKDLINTFKDESRNEMFALLLNLIEYFILTTTIVLTILWLIAPIFGQTEFSLYFLPAFGWLGLLVYLLRSLNFKSTIINIIAFIVLALVYRYGLILLMNTFAL